MRACKRCGDVKFGIQFHSEFMGYYVEIFDICKKCANELKNDAVRGFEK